MDMDSGKHDEDGGMAMSAMVDCYGKPIPERQGNWQGHVFPGVIFIIWATHWMISASWRHIVATRSGRPYVSRTTEGLLPMIPALQGFNRYPVESVLKAIGGFLLFLLQVTYGGYKTLHCEDGSPRAGRLVTQHLNSWSHASMNLGFALSGLVELLGLHARLPEGTNQVFLAGGFFIEAMLFSMHEKNGALDQTIHWLLGQTIFAAAAFTALEAAFPEAFLLTAGRVFAQMLQGTWFCQAASVLFGGQRKWDDRWEGQEDEAPAMFLPLTFTYHMLVIAGVLAAVYAAMEMLYSHRHPSPGGAAHGAHGAGGARNGEMVPLSEGSRLLSGEEEGYEQGFKSISLGSMRRG